MHLYSRPGSAQSDPFENDSFDFTPDFSQTVQPPTGHHSPAPHSDPLGVALPDSMAGLVLVNGDGAPGSGSSHATPGGSPSGTGGTTGGTSSATGQASTSPFVINVTYDASVANAP